MPQQKEGIFSGLNERKIRILKITLTAVFIGFTAALKPFSFTIPIFGANGMKCGFSGIFTAFPAILFGPLYGGVASACSDLLSCIIKPIGPWNPLYTISAFAGGFIKGLLWKLFASAVKKNGEAKIKNAVIIFIAFVGVLGSVFHISLYSDGIAKGYYTDKTEINAPAVLNNNDMSFISKLAVSPAKYYPDAAKCMSIDKSLSGKDVIIPAYAEYDTGTEGGYKVKVNRISDNALSGSYKSISFPSTVAKITAKTFQNLSKDTVIYGKAGSSAEKAAKEAGLEFIAKDVEKITEKADSVGNTQTGFFENNNAYAKALSGFINSLTIGLELTALAGALYIAVDIFFTARRKKAGKSSDIPRIRIFLCSFVSGFFVTTINTIFLKYITVPAWSDRAFMLLWAPRVTEELIMCLIQSYFIAILYDVFVTRFFENRLSKKALQSEKVQN